MDGRPGPFEPRPPQRHRPAWRDRRPLLDLLEAVRALRDGDDRVTPHLRDGLECQLDLHPERELGREQAPLGKRRGIPGPLDRHGSVFTDRQRLFEPRSARRNDVEAPRELSPAVLVRPGIRISGAIIIAFGVLMVLYALRVGSPALFANDDEFLASIESAAKEAEDRAKAAETQLQQALAGGEQTVTVWRAVCAAYPDRVPARLR